MNYNIYNKDTFFHNMMFDLKGHIRLNKAFYVYLFSSYNSSVKLTLPLMLPQIACALVETHAPNRCARPCNSVN